MGLGAVCLTSVQILVLVLQHRIDPADYPVIDPLAAGVLAAVGLGAGFAWYRSSALENLWQRGVIAVLAAVGAILIGFMAAPLERFVGLGGMIVWLAANVAFGIAGSRWAAKGAAGV